MKVFICALLAGMMVGCHSDNIAEHPVEGGFKGFELTIPGDYQVSTYKMDYVKWTKSLIRNLGYDRDQITCLEFLLTDIRITSAGRAVTGGTYVNRENPALFFDRERGLIIDFDEKVVGTGGTGGMSVHHNDDRSYCVILYPSRVDWIFGVTLGDLKADCPKPHFGEKMSVDFFLNH